MTAMTNATGLESGKDDTSTYRRHLLVTFGAIIAASLFLTVIETRLIRRAPAHSEAVAVCLTGNLRTFRYPFIHDSLRENLVATLRAAHPVTVFVLGRLDDAPRRRKAAIRDDAATLRALTQLGFVAPMHVTLFNTTDEFGHLARYVRESDSQRAHFAVPLSCGSTRRKAVPFPHAVFRMQQCLHAMRAHEQTTGIRFSWVYRARPDMIPLDPIVLPSQLRRDVFYCNQAKPNVTSALGKYWMQTRGVATAPNAGVTDQMSMSSREVADVVLDAFAGIDDCELYGLQFPVFPETVLRLWLLKNSIRTQPLAFDHLLVRENSGPECRRVTFQRGRGADWKRSMERCLRFSKAVESFFPSMPNATMGLLNLPGKSRSPEVLISS